jgi:hypothetical protein
MRMPHPPVPGGSPVTALERSPTVPSGRARLVSFVHALQQSDFAEADETGARPATSAAYVKPSERQPK